MFKKAFAIVFLATALFASTANDFVIPIPDCFPCDFAGR